MKVVNPLGQEVDTEVNTEERDESLRACGCSTSSVYATASGAVCVCACTSTTVSTRVESSVHY